MFFRDKLRHGPFPTLKTAIFIKIAKIIKNQISIMFLQNNLKSRRAEHYNVSYPLEPLLSAFRSL